LYYRQQYTAKIASVTSKHVGKQSRVSVLGCLVLTAFTGCVQRRLIVKTQPEGAAVIVDRKPVGYSPVSVPFTYYGTREVQIEKDGYKPIRVQERIDPKWFNRFSAFSISSFSQKRSRAKMSC